MKLQSMTEFVLKQYDFVMGNNLSLYKFSSPVNNYAQFLSQPLTLGMFVPCDLEGNVIKNKTYIEFLSDGGKEENYFDYLKLYQYVCERVLFEGFEITHFEGRLSGKNNLEFETVKGVFYWDLVNKKFMIEGDIYDHELKTIEDLVGFDLTLTQSEITKIKGV